MARTLSDLTSQSTSVCDSDIANFFAASGAIMTPYDSAPIKATITELYVDPNSHQAQVQWSKAFQGGAAQPAHQLGNVVSIPSALAIDGTYLIFSEVKYLYTPAVGYVMAKAGITLSDVAYTRPRQSANVSVSPASSCPSH